MIEPGAGFTMGRVAAFGYDIPYARSGHGQTIVSFPGSAGLEMSTAKDLLAKEYDIIEFDPPGWGETAAVAAEMRQRDLAVILARAIEALGIDRFHVIGTSMGGANAFWLARQFPDRVASIILEAPMLFERPEDLVRPESAGIVQAIRDGLTYDGRYPPPPPHPRKPWATPAFFHEQMRRRFKMMFFTDHPGEVGPLAEFAATTDIPTTLLLGTQDEILNAGYAGRFREVMPKAVVTMVEGATHDIQNTAPEAFVNAVRRQVG